MIKPDKRGIRIGRRGFLGAGAALTVFAGMPRQLFAADENDARFILVILRGGLDGLAAVPPYGDGQYALQRGQLALSKSDQSLLTLDGTFGLHRELANMHELYKKNELLALHAVATPYRNRSHFDGQNVLENGSAVPNGMKSGWLNRAVGTAPGTPTNPEAVALALSAPLVLQGETRVSTWAPSRLPEPDAEALARIKEMYEPHPFFAERLAQAQAADQLMGSKRLSKNAAKHDWVLAKAAGEFLTQPEGAHIAVLELTDWDSHSAQGTATGRLALRLKHLDYIIATLQESLGPTWQSTAVLITTEFGRTVAANGSGGTNHGTASCALLAGGAVKGGRVIADWPGLAPAAQYEGRDLMPTMDLRAVFKGVVQEHLGVDRALIEDQVFPDSRAVKPLEGLIRSG
jgi:uncharacterized protein (DUF1501 family)